MNSPTLLFLLCFLLSAPRLTPAANPSAPPSLLAWDAKSLYQLRRIISFAPLTTPPLTQSTALHHLYYQTTIDLAKLRKQPPPSVTSKSLTLPSATPHDYISLVPYAFPCTALPLSCHDYKHAQPDLSKCDNSTGLPWQICDGELNLHARDTQTDRPALEEMMHYVMRLSVAAYVFADSSRAKAAAAVLTAWFVAPATRMRPSLRFAQGVPGITDGKHSGCIDLSLFGRGFSDAVLLLLQTPEAAQYWTRERHMEFREWCRHMAFHMVNDSRVSPEGMMRNNHGLYYDLTVMSLLVLADGGKETNPLVMRMLSSECEGWIWCVRGRLQDQVDMEGRQVHEMDRAGYGHYVWYTLLAHSHLFSLGRGVGGRLNVEGSPLVSAAEWTLRNFGNLTKGGSESWLVYGAQALRIVSRLTGERKYEAKACEILEVMLKEGKYGKRGMWHGTRVGMDIWNIALPQIATAQECGAWVEYPRLETLEFGLSVRWLCFAWALVGLFVTAVALHSFAGKRLMRLLSAMASSSSYGIDCSSRRLCLRLRSNWGVRSFVGPL